MAYRLPTRNKKGPSPFIIKFVNRWKRDAVMERVKRVKLSADKFGGKSNIKIFSNDHST